MSCNCNQNPCCCENPCGSCTETSTTVESLPSALDNFIAAFFGTLEKTFNSDGTVTWILPCNLDIGIEANPRLENEGLACYFLRLLTEGVQGLQGDQGETGVAGADGADAFTTLSAVFTPSTEADPDTSADVVNPDIFVIGLDTFIEEAGWYLVTGKTGSTVGLTLILAIDSPSATVAIGGLVLPTGPRGASGTKGAKGDTGATGNTGATGATGVAGATGTSARTVLTTGFTQPAVGATVGATVLDGTFFEGSIQVYVTTGGYYEVTAKVGTALTLRNLGSLSAAAPGAAIASGSKIFVVGYGPKSINAMTVGVGSAFAIPDAAGGYQPLVFGTSSIDFVLPMPGVYQVTASFQILAGGTFSPQIDYKLRDTTAGSDISGTTRNITFTANNQSISSTLSALVTVTVATTLKVYMQRNATGTASVLAAQSNSHWLRVGNN